MSTTIEKKVKKEVICGSLEVELPCIKDLFECKENESIILWKIDVSPKLKGNVCIYPKYKENKSFALFVTVSPFPSVSKESCHGIWEITIEIKAGDEKKTVNMKRGVDAKLMWGYPDLNKVFPIQNLKDQSIPITFHMFGFFLFLSSLFFQKNKTMKKKTNKQQNRFYEFCNSLRIPKILSFPKLNLQMTQPVTLYVTITEFCNKKNT